MKKLLALLLTILLTVALLPMTAGAADVVLTVTLDQGGDPAAAATAALGMSGLNQADVTTLKFVNGGTPVISMEGDHWIKMMDLYRPGSGWTNLVNLDLSELTSFTTIGECNYNDVSMTSNLISVTMPSVEMGGANVFRYCTSLKEVNAPSIATAGNYMFYHCTSLTSVSLPNATAIGAGAFVGCDALVSVDLPNVETLGEGAFLGCNSLASVSLPAVTSIERAAFSSCASLVSVDLPNVETIPSNAFYNSRMLESVSLPNATTILSCAFESCIALKSVSLPAATTVGNYAFRYCSALELVSLPAATTIGKEAFTSCTALSVLEVGGNLTSVAEDAFSGVTGPVLILMDTVDVRAAFAGVTPPTNGLVYANKGANYRSGDVNSLDATIESDADVGYQWQIWNGTDWVDVEGATGATYPDATSGYYRCAVTVGGGTFHIAYSTLTSSYLQDSGDGEWVTVWPTDKANPHTGA